VEVEVDLVGLMVVRESWSGIYEIVIVGLLVRVAGQLCLLEVVVCLQQVVIFDFATDVQGRGVGHHLGSYKSGGKGNVSW
jgi:hypothetical protein